MRNKISLYIADQLVDLDDQSFILFNYTMEDLSNPTIVRNSFSKQVTLKGTPNNNKIFGDIYRLDRQTVYADSYYGECFDVNRKTPFVIYNEKNEVVESGYIRMDSVSRKGVDVEYKITLYGGLGSFFYALSYNDDGSPKSLASLRYVRLDGRIVSNPGAIFPFSPIDVLQDCWLYLDNPSAYENGEHDTLWCNIINFAPCYNGLPTDFSADKIICYKPFANVPDGMWKREDTEDGGSHFVRYSLKEGAETTILKLSKPHTEWELRDLRWYLQRPVISVKALFQAISLPENNGGWEVELSSAFFNKKNPLYEDGWITLPMIPTEDRQADNPLYNILHDSKTPMDFLLSYSKSFGLVYLVNSYKKKIQIMSRAEFFSLGNELIDLTDRIEREDINLIPTLAEKRFYQYGGEVVGEWAKEYKAIYGREYGIQRVNTGNEFNMETQDLTDGILFRNAVEVQERSQLYFSNEYYWGDNEEVYFYLPRFENVKIQLWGVSDGDSGQHMEEFDIESKYGEKGVVYPLNEEHPTSDILPKVQFHDADNKAIDGSNTLIVFNGSHDAPRRDYNAAGTRYIQISYRLTDDIPDMATLNDGVPCWNYSDINSAKLTRLPSFRRCVTHKEGRYEIIDATYEWGESYARGVHDIKFNADNPATLYNEYWKRYQTDRFDGDTLRMSCKVNLSGLQVGQDLMRNFFYYQGAIFVLNAIRNHSLTTLDNTECEFIKVQDIENYRS